MCKCGRHSEVTVSGREDGGSYTSLAETSSMYCRTALHMYVHCSVGINRYIDPGGNHSIDRKFYPLIFSN